MRKNSWGEIIGPTLRPDNIEGWKEIAWRYFFKRIYCPNTQSPNSAYNEEQRVIMSGLYTPLTRNSVVTVPINWFYRIRCCQHIYECFNTEFKAQRQTHKARKNCVKVFMFPFLMGK